MAKNNEMPTRDKSESFFKEHKKQIIVGIIILTIGFGGPFIIFQIIKVSLNTEYPFTVVLSGSMNPTIYRGDLLILQGKAPADIANGTVEGKEGDIIIYDAHGVWKYPYSVPDEPIVHRVVGKYYDNSTEKWMFWTKGDNDATNPDIDPPDGTTNPYYDRQYAVPEDKILGTVVGRIPWIGNISIFFSTNNVGLILIIIVGALLIITVIWDIISPEEEDKDKKKKEEKIRKKTMKVGEKKAEKVSMKDEFDI